MTRICPRCGSDIPVDHRLCPVCLFGEGLKLQTVRCLKCQAEVDDGARFCSECGTATPSATAVEGDPIRAALEAKLKGQYRVIRLLGRGGMGAVYLARDLALEREVAIKVVKTAEEQSYDRFRREARTAAKLSHPNIVPLHAFGEIEGMPYFVMGYVRGESLADRLERDGKLPEEDAQRVFAEIADALDHAHRQGVIHRDIKPDNVLLDDESGRALLTDFGVAKVVGKGETLTRFGNVVGAPQYMSPEQASGRSDIDGRSDIYSLGVTAYAMLAGRPPFDGNTAADVLMKHLTQQPVPVRSVAPAVSDSTAQAIERCLAKDPAGRWPDARSLKLALGVVEESHLPDALQAVEGKGIPALGITLTSLLIWVLFAASGAGWIGFIAVASSAVIACAFVVTRLRREGFAVGQSQGAIWREPAWWLWWYPIALRRRGNVWERLPATVRYLRWSVLAFAGYLCFFYFGAALSMAVPPHSRPLIVSRISLSVFATIVMTWVIFTIGARRTLKREGINPADVQRVMLTVPPSRASFWARPHIAAILGPAIGPAARRALDSPHDHLQSIIRHANELSGPLRPLGAQAANAARQLVASIDDADRLIGDLARHIEPGEETRLADKIETLAAPAAGDDECAPLRRLLEKQLDVIRGLSGRIEETKDRRNRRVEALRTLALHVASLRARAVNTPTEVRRISENVRTLCDDIGRQTMAFDSMAAAARGDDALQTVERKS